MALGTEIPANSKNLYLGNLYNRPNCPGFLLPGAPSPFISIVAWVWEKIKEGGSFLANFPFLPCFSAFCHAK
jgi:hypothetical protein